MFIFLLTLLLFFVFLLTFFNGKQYGYHRNHTPPSHPIIGCLVSFYQNRHRLLDWYTEHIAQSPTHTIVVHRLGARRTVVTANPRNVEYILKTNFGNFPKGKPFTEILGDLLGCGIFNVDGELWQVQRKLASHEFSTRSLKDFIVKTLQEEVQHRLIPLLEQASREKDVIDLQDVLRRLTFDTVCKVSLGYDPCCLDLKKPLPSLLTAFDTASEVSAARGASPVFLLWKMKRMLNMGSEKALKEAVKLVHESVMKIIKGKKDEMTYNEKNVGTDLLARLLEAGQEETVVRDMVISMIMAGRDTTSAAMTWLLWLLSKHREEEALLVKEVYCGNNRCEGLDYECLKEMKLLKACLCESMRLYPPVAWDSKHASGADVLPDGTHVGKGDRVTYFPYGMGRMEALWGKDCYEFKPKRWFDEENVDNGVLKCVNPYKFPVFQAGPRVCLGREMAFIQMEYVVASILNRFVISPVSDEHPRFVPLLTAHMAGGFKVRINSRTGAGTE
ncbi:cytochrome P450 94B3-like [Vigna umbellata]|uniref:cytochrome P450 94B3-like n=1 Tax=Vigna umbellata TaxID=87088 RepID=UPI001F5EBEF1|nr:cytochrome P450 94B3-like [Vigna umbellata]